MSISVPPSWRIAIIDGHPDPSSERLCHGLVAAYADGAKAAGHQVRLFTLASIDFPFLRSSADWEKGALPAALKDAQDAIAWADHLVFVFPLWLGAMPALMKGFLEQVLRPGFAIALGARSMHPGLLKGKTARIVITMGMPAFVYRWYFGAHSLKSFERNILRFVGIGSIRETLIGGVFDADARTRGKWLDRMRALGGKGR